MATESGFIVNKKIGDDMPILIEQISDSFSMAVLKHFGVTISVRHQLGTVFLTSVTIEITSKPISQNQRRPSPICFNGCDYDVTESIVDRRSEDIKAAMELCRKTVEKHIEMLVMKCVSDILYCYNCGEFEKAMTLDRYRPFLFDFHHHNSRHLQSIITTTQRTSINKYAASGETPVFRSSSPLSTVILTAVSLGVIYNCYSTANG